MTRELLTWTGAIGILTASVLFLFSGAVKLNGVAHFEDALVAHGLFGSGQASWAAWAIGVSEVIVGIGALCILLMADRPARAAHLVAAAFLAIAVYCWILVVVPPPKPTGCGCGFSRSAVEDWTPLALRNTGFAGLGLILSFPIRRLNRPRRPSGRAGSPPIE